MTVLKFICNLTLTLPFVIPYQHSIEKRLRGTIPDSVCVLVATGHQIDYPFQDGFHNICSKTRYIVEFHPKIQIKTREKIFPSIDFWGTFNRLRRFNLCCDSSVPADWKGLIFN